MKNKDLVAKKRNKILDEKDYIKAKKILKKAKKKNDFVSFEEVFKE